MKTKLILLLGIACLTSNVHASTWEKIRACANGAAVLDVNTDRRTNLQLVIRDKNAIDFLNQVGAIESRYGAHEVILSGTAGHIEDDNSGPQVNAWDPGVFYPQDFKGLIANYNYYFPFNQYPDFAYIFAEDHGLNVKFGHIDNRCLEYGPEECHYIGDGFGTQCDRPCIRNERKFVERASWFFPQCE